jgi:hypothetical protein
MTATIPDACECEACRTFEQALTAHQRAIGCRLPDLIVESRAVLQAATDRMDEAHGRPPRGVCQCPACSELSQALGAHVSALRSHGVKEARRTAAAALVAAQRCEDAHPNGRGASK